MSRHGILSTWFCSAWNIVSGKWLNHNKNDTGKELGRMSHEISDQEFFLLLWDVDLNQLPDSAVFAVRTLDSGPEDWGLGAQAHSLFAMWLWTKPSLSKLYFLHLLDGFDNTSQIVMLGVGWHRACEGTSSMAKCLKSVNVVDYLCPC